jgi:hypothetical protein
VIGSSRCLARLATCAALCALAATTGAATARASASCGVVTAAAHPWIVVAKSVSCTSAKSMVRHFAARTAALRAGESIKLAGTLPGFVCVLASHGKPGGSCSTAGGVRSVLWLSAV